MNKKQEKILEKHFNVYKDNNFEYELEAWTGGGVDMFITISSSKNIVDELEEYLDKFDIDTEIDLYRQDKDYKNNFTITESLKDFEDWVSFIKDIIEDLRKAGE